MWRVKISIEIFSKQESWHLRQCCSHGSLLSDLENRPQFFDTMKHFVIITYIYHLRASQLDMEQSSTGVTFCWTGGQREKIYCQHIREMICRNLELVLPEPLCTLISRIFFNWREGYDKLLHAELHVQRNRSLRSKWNNLSEFLLWIKKTQLSEIRVLKFDRLKNLPSNSANSALFFIWY